MIIELKKFGNILTSRESGREALSAFLPTLNSATNNEKIMIDFEGVSVLTPSWADEFVRPIVEKYAEKVAFVNDTNPSVQSSLRFANPKLDLGKITIFADAIVFDEITDDRIYDADKTWLVLTFPYNDENALRILKNNKVKKISVYPVDHLSDTRLKSVTEMLRQANIEATVISKGEKHRLEEN